MTVNADFSVVMDHRMYALETSEINIILFKNRTLYNLSPQKEDQIERN